MTIDAKTFDMLVSYAPEMTKALHVPARFRLTPARILVLAMMSQSASRTDIRKRARVIRHTSRYRDELRRVHFHTRLYQILRDLHELGLAQAKRRRNGTFRFTLDAPVRRRVNLYLQRAIRAAKRAV